jgi:hypothetical protein
MSATKKVFIPLMSLLNANQDAKVSDILEQAQELTSAKSGGGGSRATTFHKDEDGVVVAIRCYYHQKWMDPRVVEFGNKASSPTGFNNMCKEGVSNWTRQEREAKKANAELLNRIIAGDLDPSDAPAEQEAIEAARNEVAPREDGYGYDTLEELLDAAQ